jgi:hypothetical protein
LIRHIALGSSLTLALVVGMVPPAHASDSSEDPIVDAEGSSSRVRASEALVSESLSNVARFDALRFVTSRTGGEAAVGGVNLGDRSVKVPTHPEDGFTITDGNGQRVEIHLPNAAGASVAQVLDNGAVTFPGGTSANSVIVTDFSVQMFTTIANANGPTRYSYEVGFEQGQRLKLTDNGAVVVNADGSIYLAVASPWAKDANGKDIPTHYEVDRNDPGSSC